MRLAGISVRVGYARKWGWLLTHRILDEKVLGECHEVEYNLRLLKPLGIKAASQVALQLPVYHDSATRIQQRFDSLEVTEVTRVVAVHPWTSKSS